MHRKKDNKVQLYRRMKEKMCYFGEKEGSIADVLLWREGK
jgi:hypothetical protein